MPRERRERLCSPVKTASQFLRAGGGELGCPLSYTGFVLAVLHRGPSCANDSNPHPYAERHATPVSGCAFISGSLRSPHKCGCAFQDGSPGIRGKWGPKAGSISLESPARPPGCVAAVRFACSPDSGGPSPAVPEAALQADPRVGSRR